MDNAPSNYFNKENLRQLTQTVATTVAKMHFEAVTSQGSQMKCRKLLIFL
jgi:hypothetical protein